MSKLKGAVLLGQSGGPTSVINASAAGVFLEALKHDEITEVYGAKNGILGILNEEFYDIRKEELEELRKLKYTPSSAIGSVRYKLMDYDTDDREYAKLLEIFKKYNIRYFFYNGGNDSMDTCHKISEYMKNANWDMRVIGVPKTIDNDLAGMDHTPGFGSAAKFVATAVMELTLDARVYEIDSVTIVEVMGRNAGWLTASAYLGSVSGVKPDLIYLPEKVFDIDQFVNDVSNLIKKQGQVVVVVSEGIQTADGKYVAEYGRDLQKDAFGHASLGGAANVLTKLIKEKTGAKVRPIEFSLVQRSASHIASNVDIEEAFEVGRNAVLAALAGESDKVVSIQRESSNPYVAKYVLMPLEGVANLERTVPLEWIKDDNTGLTKEFIDYALPLIQGETKQDKEHGLPVFAKLKKVLVNKK